MITAAKPRSAVGLRDGSDLHMGDQAIEDSERVITPLPVLSHQPYGIGPPVAGPEANDNGIVAPLDTHDWLGRDPLKERWHRDGRLARTNSTMLINVSSSNSPCTMNGKPRTSSEGDRGVFAS